MDPWTDASDEIRPVDQIVFVCIYAAVGGGDRQRPQTASPVCPPVPAPAACFVPIDPAKPPPPPAARRRRLPDIPRQEESGDAGAAPATEVVLRQRSGDARRLPVRPDSGIGAADLGVAAAAAASRDSWHSVQFPSGESPSFFIIRQGTVVGNPVMA